MAMQIAQTNARMDAQTNARPRRLRTAAALLAGFVAVVALSTVTDQVLHSLGVYPPWDQPMHDPALNLLALAYRCVYGALGSYLAARLAPSAPMAHALALGAVGFALSLAGTVAMWDVGPNWYPVAVTLTALPCAWLGGALHRHLLRRG